MKRNVSGGLDPAQWPVENDKSTTLALRKRSRGELRTPPPRESAFREDKQVFIWDTAYTAGLSVGFVGSKAASVWIVDRVRYASECIATSVSVDRSIRSGLPVFTGTRVPVSQVIAEIADGESIFDVAEDLEIDQAVLQEFFRGLSAALDVPIGLSEPVIRCEHTNWMNARIQRS